LGAALGIPEWLAATLFVVVGVSLTLIYGLHKRRRKMQALSAKRPSPDRTEFLTLMTASVEETTAAWMWATLLPYYEPLTPHPDDHLLADACIDDDDITMDWLPRFAEDRGLRWQDWPEWPADWELTVLNFARWLQLGSLSGRRM
jgi:hypothetical protein